MNLAASEPVRPISDEAFDRILAQGLIEDDELLPREEALNTSERVHDPQE